jgi:hypothetical protein
VKLVFSKSTCQPTVDPTARLLFQVQSPVSPPVQQPPSRFTFAPSRCLHTSADGCKQNRPNESSGLRGPVVTRMTPQVLPRKHALPLAHITCTWNPSEIATATRSNVSRLKLHVTGLCPLVLVATVVTPNWEISLSDSTAHVIAPAMARLADAPCLQISGAALSGTLVAKNFNDRSSIASPLTSSRSVRGAPQVDHELRAVWAYLHTR